MNTSSMNRSSMNRTPIENAASPARDDLGQDAEPSSPLQRLQARWVKSRARSRANKKIARRKQALTGGQMLLGAAGILALALLGGLNVVQWQKLAQQEETNRLIAQSEEAAEVRKAEEAKAEREDKIKRGRALFEGRTPLQARMARHEGVLPALASSCANCHGVGANGSPLASGLMTVGSSRLAAELRLPSNASNGLAPVLNKVRLDEDRPRRGGPPSRYDAQSLCRLLSTGVDPASVIIDTSMPRYSITTAQCVEFWAYLVAD